MSFDDHGLSWGRRVATRPCALVGVAAFAMALGLVSVRWELLIVRCALLALEHGGVRDHAASVLMGTLRRSRLDPSCDLARHALLEMLDGSDVARWRRAAEILVAVGDDGLELREPRRHVRCLLATEAPHHFRVGSPEARILLAMARREAPPTSWVPLLAEHAVLGDPYVAAVALRLIHAAVVNGALLAPPPKRIPFLLICMNQ